MKTENRVAKLLDWRGCFIQIIGGEPGRKFEIMFESGSCEESKAICNEAIRILSARHKSDSDFQI